MTTDKKAWVTGLILDGVLIAIGAAILDGGDALIVLSVCVAAHWLGIIVVFAWEKIRRKTLSGERWVAYGPLYIICILIILYVALLLLPSRNAQ